MKKLAVALLLVGMLPVGARGQAVAFVPASTWTMTSTRPSGATLDGNGLPDILPAGAGVIEIMRSMGSNSFAFSASSTGGFTPSDVAVADVNGDGKLAALASGADEVSYCAVEGDTIVQAIIWLVAGVPFG